MGRSLRVEADGGSRGNPGVAGYGALVRDESGRVLVRLAEPLGKVSNNVAEYRGLIAGLSAAARIDAGARIEAALDSKLVVEQMAGRWKIKHADMRALALQAREIVREIEAAGGSVTYTWIPRAENTDADALSNDAMDGRTIEDWTDGAPGEGGAAPAAGEEPRSGTGHAPDAGVGLSREDVEPTRDTDQIPAQARPGRGRPTRVLLVRHGVTPFTEQARLDGRGGPDPSLSDAGRAQAAAAARSAALLVGDDEVQVITSGLARAKETGAAIAEALGVEPVVDADWDEQSFGDWDGLAAPDLIRDHPDDFLALRDDPTYARPGGESHEDLQERVLAAWERAVARGGTVIVACHRKPIMVVLGHVLGMPTERLWRLAGAPGSLNAVEAWPDGHAVVAFTNRT
ncbi:bifunctional RNase H/acid phosphatase [Janibacter sp. GXQ6167]|uniref:bifunctional RNase H/acid phosphatase n=1 Tax=Janibacter sp. GXQ6167 TaxID=3240791 RepID=UPI003523FE82